MSSSILQPVFPIDGDVLHAFDGNVTADGLQCTVQVAAPTGSRIYINGRQATEKEGGIFVADILFNNYHNILEIRESNTGEATRITVYYAKKFAGKYRLSIDDNIRFLQDIAAHADSYNSLFDNPYLKGLQQIHQQYRIKVHLNLLYQSVDGDFTLSEFPDSYKNEWETNAGWLRLSFHAYSEFPDEPYKNASYEKVKEDCDLIVGHIKRFAGESVLGPVTTIHWGELNRNGAKALRDSGYRCLAGYFNVDDDEAPVSYYCSVEERRHVKKRFIWKDETEDIIFTRNSMVLDKTAKQDIAAKMNAYARMPSGLPPYVDYLI
ncbi:MAG: hypothetical protein H3C48_15420, partial [Chitinophagaceae bacterium]|nr:hypothetical protein [Chitinophagaceae bacterium]